MCQFTRIGGKFLNCDLINIISGQQCYCRGQIWILQKLLPRSLFSYWVWQRKTERFTAVADSASAIFIRDITTIFTIIITIILIVSTFIVITIQGWLTKTYLPIFFICVCCLNFDGKAPESDIMQDKKAGIKGKSQWNLLCWT